MRATFPSGSPRLREYSHGMAKANSSNNAQAAFLICPKPLKTLQKRLIDQSTDRPHGERPPQSQSDPRSSDLAQNIRSFGVTIACLEPQSQLRPEPFGAFQEICQRQKDTRACIKRTSRCQDRLMVGDAIAKRADGFKSRMDDRARQARGRKGAVKAGLPQRPVIATRSQIAPEAEG